MNGAQFFFVKEGTSLAAVFDKIFALFVVELQVRDNLLRIKLRVLLVSVLVNKNIPAPATMRPALRAIAFELADVLRLKVKKFLLH